MAKDPFKITALNFASSGVTHLPKLNPHIVPGYTFDAGNNLVQPSQKGKTSMELQQEREAIKIQELNANKYTSYIEGGLQLPVGWDDKPQTPLKKDKLFGVNWSGNVNTGKTYDLPLSPEAVSWYQENAPNVILVDKAAMAKSSAKKRNRAKLQSDTSFMKSNPYLDEANTIRTSLGLEKMFVKSHRHRRGKYSAVWAAKRTKANAAGQYTSKGYDPRLGYSILVVTPTDVVQEHYNKKSIVNFGKKYGLKLTSDDVGTWITGEDSKLVKYEVPGYSGYKTVKTTLQRTGAPENEIQEVDLLHKKFMTKRDVNEKRYEKLHYSITSDEEKELKKNIEKINLLEKKVAPLNKKASMNSKYPHYAAVYRAQAKPYSDKITKLTQRNLELKGIIKEGGYSYYTVTDEQFKNYDQYKSTLLSNIGSRKTNQQIIIDNLKLDRKTIEQKDRQNYLIPVLEETTEKLDKKKDILIGDIGVYDWRKKISEESFGTTTIQGDSHVSEVVGEMGHGIRQSLWMQDVGKLIKKTKTYEEGMAKKIEEKTQSAKEIELDEKDALVDYYNKKQEKEILLADKDYTSRSLVKTKQEREELEKQYKQSAYEEMHASGSAKRYNISQSRGRPSLRSLANMTSNKKRIRGGKNTLGGLVI
jgi:hypothetical protein